MDYSSPSPPMIPLTDLSLNVFDHPGRSWLASHLPLSYQYSPYGIHSYHPYNSSSGQWYPSRGQHTASVPFTFKVGQCPPWPLVPPQYRNAGKGGTFIPHVPESDFPPPSPSDTCSSISSDTAASPITQSIHVICDVPLVAPVPLPYHSPTFLQFDLPDVEEDLSHPPYTRRPQKRKREMDSCPDEYASTKRHAKNVHQAPRNHAYSRCRPAQQKPLHISRRGRQ